MPSSASGFECPALDDYFAWRVRMWASALLLLHSPVLVSGPHQSNPGLLNLCSRWKSSCLIKCTCR